MVIVLILKLLWTDILTVKCLWYLTEELYQKTYENLSIALWEVLVLHSWR